MLSVEDVRALIRQCDPSVCCIKQVGTAYTISWPGWYRDPLGPLTQERKDTRARSIQAVCFSRGLDVTVDAA